MPYGLKDHIIKKIQEVFAKYAALERVVLYGSRAKGNYTIGSDIDLTMIGENIEHRTINKITNDLDDLMLPYRIDVSIYQHIKNKELIAHINRVGKIIFKREELRN